MKISTWVGLITGLAMVGGVLTRDLWLKEELGGPFERPAKIEQISNQTYPITLKYENGGESKESLRLSVELDREKNTLYVGNYTKDYNKQDWTGKLEKVPAYAKHTRINPFSKTILIHPPEVKVSGMEQRIHLAPQYGWSQEAKPYEKHEEAQRMIEGGEKLIDTVFGIIPFPFLKDIFRSWSKSKEIEEKERILKIANKLACGYTATIIPSYIKDKLTGSIETAREYKISLSEGQPDMKIPIYLLTQIVLGDPTNAASGSFPNKYGKLEAQIIEISLGQRKMKFEDYFLQGQELRTIRLDPRGIGIKGFDSNPSIIDGKTKPELEKQGVIKIGLAKYILPSKKRRDDDLKVIVASFSSEERKNEFRATQRYPYPIFVGPEIIVMEESENLQNNFNHDYSLDQKLAYIDFLFNFEERTGTTLIVERNEMENKRVLKRLKEIRRKYNDPEKNWRKCPDLILN